MVVLLLAAILITLLGAWGIVLWLMIALLAFWTVALTFYGIAWAVRAPFKAIWGEQWAIGAKGIFLATLSIISSCIFILLFVNFIFLLSTAPAAEWISGVVISPFFAWVAFMAGRDSGKAFKCLKHG